MSPPQDTAWGLPLSGKGIPLRTQRLPPGTRQRRGLLRAPVPRQKLNRADTRPRHLVIPGAVMLFDDMNSLLVSVRKGFNNMQPDLDQNAMIFSSIYEMQR